DGDGDPSWDPGNYVSNPTSGYYYVGSTLVNMIKSDFTILENDSTRLVPSATPDYWELSGVASGDLADVLGLQSGDILISVNSYDLGSIEDIIDAYDALENTSTLVLAYERSNSVYTHVYII